MVDTPNEPWQYWIEIYDTLHVTITPITKLNLTTTNQTTMLKSSLFDYIHAYILVEKTAVASSSTNNRSKKVIFKNYSPCTNSINEINNKQIDHAKDVEVVMPLYN